MRGISPNEITFKEVHIRNVKFEGGALYTCQCVYIWLTKRDMKRKDCVKCKKVPREWKKVFTNLWNNQIQFPIKLSLMIIPFSCAHQITSVSWNVRFVFRRKIFPKGNNKPLERLHNKKSSVFNGYDTKKIKCHGRVHTRS